MSEHLPVLQVVTPLLAAPLCALVPGRHLSRAFATLATWLTFAIATGLLHTVQTKGPLSYALGGWAAPWGIEYRVDHATVLVLIVVSGLAALVVPAGPGAQSHEVPAGRHSSYYASFLLCLAGLLGMVVTADAFNVFVFLEISSLATYALVALGKGRRALRAAFTYLLIGTVGGTFVLLGIGLLYQATGSLNMADIAQRLHGVEATRTVAVACAFLSVGLAIKLAVFPLHQWLVGAYAYAPSSVSAFVAGTSTKVIYYVLLRFLLGVFGVSLAFGALGFGAILLPLSLAAMFIGSLAALYQKDLKRLLAYSSIAQIGYLTLGLSFGTQEGISAGLLHLINHAVTKCGLFLVCACLIAQLGSSRLMDLRGVGKRMPVTTLAFVVGGLGMIGVPGTAGFVSKWYLVSAAMSSGDYWVAGLILMSSLLAVAYVWRVVELAYLRKAPADAPRGEAPYGLLIPTLAALGASLYFGLDATSTVRLASQAATDLLRGGI